MSRQVLQIPPDPALEPLKIRDFLGIKETVFAFFLLAGMFKAVPGLEDSPIDLTILSALITLGFVVYRAWRHKERRYGALFLLLGFYVAFLPTLLWTNWHDYAIEKASRFYTLTLVATITPLYLIRTSRDLRRFSCAFASLSAVTVACALVSLLTAGKDLERLVALSATTIGLARAMGVLLLFLATWWFKSGEHYFIVAASLVLFGVLLVAVGERGPMIATAVVFASIYVLFRRDAWRGIMKACFLIVAVLGVSRIGVAWLPESSLLRVQSFFGGEFGTSEYERADFFSFSWRYILEHPLGVGLGGFADLYGANRSTDRVFPHNIVLETFVEGGWMAGIYLLGLSWLALRRAYSLAMVLKARLECQFLFCMFLFFLINEQVSGELNDSKAFFAFMALCIGLVSKTNEKAESSSSYFRAPALRPANIS
jgi:O-antigen ligase